MQKTDGPSKNMTDRQTDRGSFIEPLYYVQIQLSRRNKKNPEIATRLCI